MEISDKPDLQSFHLDCGIEVTECKTKYDGIVDEFTRSYLDRTKSDEFIEDKIKKMKIGGWFHRAPNGAVVFAPHYGLVDMPSRHKLIASCIDKKSSKSTGYVRFSTMGLYLFCKHSYDNEDIKDIISYIQNNNFNNIYFDCMNKLYIYSKDDNITKEIVFNMEQYSACLSILGEEYSI